MGTSLSVSSKTESGSANASAIASASASASAASTYLSVRCEAEPGEARASFYQGEKSSCRSLHSQAPAKVKILFRLSSSYTLISEADLVTPSIGCRQQGQLLLGQ